jgi:hypothetical protein
MNDSHPLIDGIKLRKAVYLDTFQKEAQSRLTGPMASCAPLFEEFRAVAAAVHDWEFKESCRQDMEKWRQTGPWCGLGIPAAYYACRYEDNLPRSEYEKLKSRMDKIEISHPGISSLLAATTEAAKKAAEGFWRDYVEQHGLLK